MASTVPHTQKGLYPLEEALSEEHNGVTQAKGAIALEEHFSQRENKLQTPLGEKSLLRMRNKQRQFMEGLRNWLRSRSFIWKYNKESLEHFKLGNYMVRFVLERSLGLHDGKFIHPTNTH